MSSPYGAGAPSYPDAEQQRSAITGRLKVAQGIRDRATPGTRRHARWSQITDELLDRLNEVRGL